MTEPDIASVARLIGDPARAKMLVALMGGKALTASELALEADITPQTASSHLAKLVENQLLSVRKQSRHRYFQLQSEGVAELIESLLNVSATAGAADVFTGPRDIQLRKARVCYDHLAGELGVFVYDSLLKNRYIDGDTQAGLTDSGLSFFEKLGVDFQGLKRAKRPLCKSCLDWSERRSHLAGSLGKWILQDIFSKKWAHKELDSRAVRFTPSGLKSLQKRYGAF